MLIINPKKEVKHGRSGLQYDECGKTNNNAIIFKRTLRKIRLYPVLVRFYQCHMTFSDRIELARTMQIIAYAIVVCK